jgi:hypothetical protein
MSAEDVAEIRQLLAEYGLAADECRFKDWARLFTREGEMRSPSRTVRGFDALVEFISTAAEGLHLGCTPRIRLSGDRAHATTPFLFVTHAGEIRAGVYEDELCRTPQGWRIRSRSGRLRLTRSP